MNYKHKAPALNQILMLIIFSLLLSVNTFGQATVEKTDPRKHSLYKGAKALQFTIGSNLTLGSFQGVALSGKKQYSDKTAIRAGIDLYINVADYDFNASRIGQNPNYTVRSSVSNTERIELRTQYMRYYSLKEVVKAYWAMGPLVEFGRSFFEERRNDQTTNHTKRKNLEWAVGAAGALGVEWFAARNISIHSEYIVTFDYVWDREESDSESGGDTYNYIGRNQGIRLNADNVKFGLSAYF